MVATIDDYCASVCIPRMIKVPQLKGGAPVRKNGRLVKYCGGFCVVFPYQVQQKKYALRCWHSEVNETQRRLVVIADTLRKSSLPYFIEFEYVPDAVMTASGMQPALVMDWVEAVPLKQYISDNLRKPEKLDALSNIFLKMVKDLHSAKISHGDLQHSNILVRPDGMLTLVDYDSMYVPALEGSVEEIKGLAGYQHPARTGQKFLSPRSDYFSELVIYTAIKAIRRHPRLWEELHIEGSNTLVFSESDILSGGSAEIFSILDGDAELHPLCKSMQDALRQTDMEKLLPLECCLEGTETSIVRRLKEKWSDSDYSMVVGKIAKRWRHDRY